jgi:Na+/alanine symporter
VPVTSFLYRWIFAFVLVAATYNPSQFNYVGWSIRNYQNTLSMVVLLGLMLVIAYIIYLRATLRSIGLLGMALVAMMVAAIIWVLEDYTLLNLNDPDQTLWIGIFGLSIILGVGMSWSHVRRFISGQSDIDDISE